MMINSSQTLPWTVLFWKPITYPTVCPEYYLISTTGLVMSLIRNKLLSPFENNSGYLCYHLKGVDRQEVKVLAHRLVAYEFCNPPENFMELDVNHIDGFKHHNFDVNLEWVDKSQNMIHAYENGLCRNYNENHYISKITNQQAIIACKCLEEGHMTYKQIAVEMGLNPNDPNIEDLIGNIKRGITWKNISKDYNVTNHTGRPFNRNEIVQICEMIDANCSIPVMFETMYQIPYVSVSRQKRKNFYEFIRCLRKGQFHSFDYITKNFEFSKFNDYSVRK